MAKALWLVTCPDPANEEIGGYITCHVEADTKELALERGRTLIAKEGVILPHEKYRVVKIGALDNDQP